MKKEKKAFKLFDAQNNWIGIEIRQEMTREEAEKRYPETFAKMLIDEKEDQNITNTTMRTRREIEADTFGYGTSRQVIPLELEVLLDIRDLLSQEKEWGGDLLGEDN